MVSSGGSSTQVDSKIPSCSVVSNSRTVGDDEMDGGEEGIDDGMLDGMLDGEVEG